LLSPLNHDVAPRVPGQCPATAPAAVIGRRQGLPGASSAGQAWKRGAAMTCADARGRHERFHAGILDLRTANANAKAVQNDARRISSPIRVVFRPSALYPWDMPLSDRFQPETLHADL